MKILHLVPTLGYSGSAAQLTVLAKQLPTAHSLRIICLAGEGPRATDFRQLGHRVDCLHWTRAFDPTPLWKLHRSLAADPPDLIHVWGRSALRTLGLVGRRWLERTMVSQPLPRETKNISRIDRWLLSRVRSVVASSQAEAERCRNAGIGERQLTVIPPGVEVPGEQLESSRNNAADFGSGSRKQLLCVGALDARKGYRDAIWALDILRYVFQETRLTLVGDGPQRDYLQWFAGCLELSRSVDLLGPRADVLQLLGRADVCWAPTVAGTSRQVILEAMAAGRPVVAADRPELRETIADGQTGYLVPAGDKVAMCKRTRELFLNEEHARQMGEAARRHVATHFAADTFRQRWRDHYAAAG